MWICQAIDDGLILASRAAHHSGGPEAATEWFKANYEVIPKQLRPDQQSLEEFAAFFSTYLTSSFDVIEKPGTKGTGPLQRFGCTCDLCLRIANAPHLQAKKLYARDKLRAEQLMTECLQMMAAEHGMVLSESSAERLVKNERTRRWAAYMAYGHWLIMRLMGESDGPSLLALWRLIAWDPRGGVQRGFTLELKDFRLAEEMLVDAISNV